MSGRDHKKILITGGAGFIGYHLTRRLCREPDTEVILIDNFQRGRRDGDLESVLDEPNVTCIEGDLTGEEIFREIGNGYDEVYHLAAMIGVRHILDHPDKALRTNALSTLNLLDWWVTGGGGKLLLASTSEAYSWTRTFHDLPLPTPEDVPLALTDLDNPRSSYAGSKIFKELALRQYGKQHAKPFTIVRYHNVYGPRMGMDHVIPELFARARAEERPLKVYSADHRRAFCYLDDAIEATVRAMRTPAADGETINIGNDACESTIGDLALKILDIAGAPSEIDPIDAPHDHIARRLPDITKMKRILHFVPSVGLDEGLEKTLAWYRDHPV